IKSEIKDADKLETIKDFDRVLGLNLLDNTKVEINPEAQELIEKRQLARKLGNWTESDELRDRLKEEFAVVIEDTPEGQRVVS
ncbi:MAG TPA: cysteine--tRNA ligase, partial [Candidatus Dojkabacteria bacterium]|nr:cysteine--tRNA ligase [Candidatus Dojkabacteria bacterium]